jgi:type II secretory pathway pseudopilin PulG
MRKRLPHGGVARRHDGFSMVELLVTIVLAGTVFASMVPFFLQAQERNSADNFRNMSLAAAQDRVEKVRFLDYNEITEPNLNSPTFKDGQFGPTVDIESGAGTRHLDVAYTVELRPTGTTSGSEQYKIVKVDVSWTAPPTPVYHTIVQTQIYKQYAGPQIDRFTVLQNGDDMFDLITADTVTLQARINSADLDSMGGGKVEFTITNWQGTVIAHHPVTVANGGVGVYEWLWTTPVDADGQYSFKAVAYSGQSFQGNSLQLNYWVEKGPPPAPGPVQATPGNNNVALSWPNSTATDIDRYEVWRAEEVGGVVGAYALLGNTGLTTNYNDLAVTNTHKYWYRVYAYDMHLNVSPPSTAVTATPFVVTSDTHPPSVPSLTTCAKAGLNLPTIDLAWTASTDPDGMGFVPHEETSGLRGYVIQRAANNTFTVDLATLENAYPNLTYADAAAGYSHTWYYRIAALDNAGNQSAFSNVLSATTDAAPTYTLTVNNVYNGKLYVWVQSNVSPFYYYNQSGTGSATRTISTINKNGHGYWNNLPAAPYTVYCSASSSGSPQLGSKGADLSGGNVAINMYP